MKDMDIINSETLYQFILSTLKRTKIIKDEKLSNYGLKQIKFSYSHGLLM